MAGVIGTRKFAYDVWGDTVNIAARMEAASEPNRVLASAVTVKALEIMTRHLDPGLSWQLSARDCPTVKIRTSALG
jgi:class 3 adenylate cyclase